MKFITLLAIIVTIMVAGTRAQSRRCPQRAPVRSCVGPRNVGTRCAAVQPRTMWYYNQATGACTEMRHLGCGGNSNRWCSRRGCERRCVRPRTTA